MRTDSSLYMLPVLLFFNNERNMFMHCLTIGIVEIPQISEDFEGNKKITTELEKVEKELLESNKKTEYMLRCFRETLSNLETTFSRVVYHAVKQRMNPYFVATTDPAYLKFNDLSDYVIHEYDQTKIDCLKLPQGLIISMDRDPYGGRFVIVEGKVYENDAGPVYQQRRTKRAKRIKALPQYPAKKLYPEIKQFGEEWLGIPFDEEKQAFGMERNPNGIWDYYNIGGRWPYLLLVKESCSEYSIGERSWSNWDKEYEAPKGYCWASAARFKDIEWKELWKQYFEQSEQRFQKLEHYYKSGEQPPNTYWRRTDKGVLFRKKYQYYAGETLDDYRIREGLVNRKYPITPLDLWDKKGNWYSSWKNKDSSKPMCERVDEILATCNADDVIVVIDYHC